jgi:hypothetical protein
MYLGGGLLTLGNATRLGHAAPIGGSTPESGFLPYATVQLGNVAAQPATTALDATPGAGQLTNQQLHQIVSAALVRLADAGVSPALLARLASATYEVGQLPRPLLGYTFARDHTVIIDASAAGYGWFIDPTPLSDQAFALDALGKQTAIPGSPANGHMDLLTVVLHEMGHLDGLPDISTQRYPNNLMDGTLATGVRRTEALDAIFMGGSRSGP